MADDDGSGRPADGTRAALIGVLAIQGGFEAHERVLRAVGAQAREVRVRADLEGLEGLVLPGGESTAIMLGIEREGLAEPLRALAASGVPVLGSCAGLILLDRDHLGVMDMHAARNAFGRQAKSFEADVTVRGLGEGGGEAAMRGVFIRAPWIADHGERVEILASVDGHPVAAREADLVAVSFHTELAGEDRLHRWLVQRAIRRRERLAGDASGRDVGG